MKKLICMAISIALMSNVIGQEKFTVPEIDNDIKHYRSVAHIMWMGVAGISFAKSHNVSALEYGNYVGSLFTQGWDKEKGFEGFVKGVLYNQESFQTNKDTAIIIVEQSESTLSYKIPVKSLKQYVGDESYGVTFEEFTNWLEGIYAAIANHMGCSFKMEMKDEWIVYIIAKN